MCFAVKTLRNFDAIFQSAHLLQAKSGDRGLRISLAPQTNGNRIGQVEIETRQEQVIGRKQWTDGNSFHQNPRLSRLFSRVWPEIRLRQPRTLEDA